ncbi:MAG: VOC family protein, partial [Candidatus Limnocylindrales bacterium]
MLLRDLPVHTTLPVSDLARARRFYEETLGFVADR